MDAAVRLQQAFRQLPLVLLCLYLLFSPVWYPAAAPRMYDNARSLQLGLLVAVALLTLLPAVGGALAQSWGAISAWPRRLLLLLLGGGSLSAVVSTAPRIGLLHVAVIAQLVVTALVVSAAVRREPEQAQRVLLVAVFGGAALVTLDFWVTFSLYLLEGKLFPWISPFLDFANVRFFSQYQAYAVLLVPLPVLALRLGWPLKALVYLVAANFWALQWMVGTRAVWIGLLAALLVVGLFVRNGRSRWLRTQLVVVLAGAAIFLLFTHGLLSKPDATPIPVKNSVTQRNQNSIGERIDLAKGALRIVRQQPLLGVGPGQFGFQYSTTIAAHPHNSALQLLAEYGVLAGGAGVLLCVLLAGSAIRSLRRLSQDKTDMMGITLGAALVMGLADALFSGNLSMPHSQVMFAVIVGWFLGRRPVYQAIPVSPVSRTALVGVAVLAAGITMSLASLYLQVAQGLWLPFIERGPNLWQFGRFAAW